MIGPRFRPWSLMTWVLLLLLFVNLVGIYVVGQRQSRLLRQQHDVLMTLWGDLGVVGERVNGLLDELDVCRGEHREGSTSRSHRRLVVPVSLRESERP